jgi:quercetin dioxygenase-like cupin family protein
VSGSGRPEECDNDLLTEEAVALAPLALPPLPPSAGLRQRLLKSAERAGRHLQHLSLLGALFQCDERRARHLLKLLDDPRVWAEMSGVCSLIHVRPEPALASADVGFVRVQAGEEFPWHRHLGPEEVLVLQGGFEDSLGGRTLAGERSSLAAGTEHSLRALPGQDLIYAVVVLGVEIPSAPLPAEGELVKL